MTALAEVFRQFDIHPKKKWGQCFLHDQTIAQHIVDEAEIQPTDTVFEIGAGLGILTRLVQKRAKHLVAIERDPKLLQVLKAEFGDQSHVDIVEGDALCFELNAIQETPIVVIGNLPYSISSPMIFRLLTYRHAIRVATLMVQKEFGERIVAAPGCKAYGIPSVLCQTYAIVEECFEVNRGAFVPRPKVESLVIKMHFLPDVDLGVEEMLYRRVVAAAFGKRRKMLRGALGTAFSKEQVMHALHLSGIDGDRRGETLSREEFCRLAQCFSKGLDRF